MMDNAEQVELHSKRRRMQMMERNVKQRRRMQVTERNVKQMRIGGGPSTARPPPRQIATPVFRSNFVSMWCRSCNQAHSELECQRRNCACYTCSCMENWAREYPNAVLGFLRDSGGRGPARRGQSGPPFNGRGVPQHSGGKTGGRVSSHELGISKAAYDTAGPLEEGDGTKPSDS